MPGGPGKRRAPLLGPIRLSQASLEVFDDRLRLPAGDQPLAADILKAGTRLQIGIQGNLDCTETADNASIFQPDIKELSETCLDVQMMACPIKDAWVEAGCSDEEVCTLLHCASALDEATFEAAGFAYEIGRWSPGKQGCCRTKITEKIQT